MYLKHPILSVILTALLFNTASAQYRKSMQDYYYSKGIDSRRTLQRISIGVGKYFMSGNTDLHYTGYNKVTSEYSDKQFKQGFSSKQSYVIHAGTFIPISLVSDNSLIAFNVELLGSHAVLATDSLNFLSSTKFAVTHETYMVGLPLSLEFKFGGEVTLSKRNRTLFDIGAGIIPAIVNSDDYNNIKPYRFTPFIKAEAGFVAGIAIKLRAVAYIGSSKYFTTTFYGISGPDINDALLASGKGSNGYMFSLILMPFSYSWNTDF